MKKLICLSGLIIVSFIGTAQNVGIGTNTPLAKLHVADSAVLFSAAGDIDLPTPAQALPYLAEKRLLFWLPSKAAFRVGYGAANTYTNIGDYSFAQGYQNIASGSNSVSMGAFSTASGNYSFAMGYGANAEGESAVALGDNATAGNGSFAMGGGSNATNGSFAFGNSTHASGVNSFSFGNNTFASGPYSFAFGNDLSAGGGFSAAFGSVTWANGNGSLATGFTSQALGDYSAAIGYFTAASGKSSFAIGDSTTASGYASNALGYGTEASGDFSSALGYLVSTNGHKGSIFFGDADPHNKGLTLQSADNQFAARFNGGYYFITDNSGTVSTGVRLNAGDNSWSAISDSSRKEKLLPVDGEKILQQIAGMKLSSWNYKGQNSKSARHYGPMAQDFYSAFGHDAYGTIGNDTLINQQDFLGVSFAGIQALQIRTSRLEGIENTNMVLQQKNTELAAQLEQLKNTVALLKEQVQAVVSQQRKEEKIARN